MRYKHPTHPLVLYIPYIPACAYLARLPSCGWRDGSHILNEKKCLCVVLMLCIGVAIFLVLGVECWHVVCSFFCGTSFLVAQSPLTE